MCTRVTSGGLPLVSAALLALGCSDSVTSAHRAHPGPAFALEAISIAGQALSVPSGFNLNLFAEGLGGARSLALGPDGAVFVTLSNNGEIVRLVDADGDGIADARSTVLSGLAYPFGLAFRGDTMYFAEQIAVRRLDPGATTPVTVIPNLPGGGHVTRTIAFGPDNLLYVAIGSSCNVCDDALPRAAVTRYNRDGSNPRTFATGLRNSVGLAFHPTTGELWANNNDRDDLGSDVPPEHLNILRDGRWYGWPRCYLPGKANPEYPTADCSSVEPPALTFQAHSAPLGLAFYTGAMFPDEYQGDAFMTYHGSWNRSEPTGAKVVRVQVQNGRPAAIDDFVTGWQLADGSRWGRPVGLLVMPDGALLVSDDLGGRIWRVSYGQSPPDETGDLDVTTATAGSNRDPDGYTVTVDGSQSQPIGIDGSVTFTNLSAGSHSVALTNVAGNCTVSGANPRSVTVPSGGTATAGFSVSCTATATTGDLTVATSTTGSGIPATFTLNASGPAGSTTQAIAPNTSVTFSAIATGDYTVSLSDVPANCTVGGANPRTVTVPSGGTGSTTFSVSCTATTGNLTVTTSTSGSSAPSGYTVTVDGSQSQAIGANASVTFTNLSAGGHSVALTNVAGNCTVGGGNPRSVTVPSGGTVATAFSVSCAATTGNLTVTTTTSGSSAPSGYTVTVDGSQNQAIGANASVTFTNLSAGGHSVALTNAAGNCTVGGANPRSVTVPSGGTVAALFSVSCTTPTPPIVNAGADQAVLLGVSYTLPDASFSDQDNDGPWSYTIAWGDGSTSTGSRSSQGSLTGAHNYLVPGTYGITVTVTDTHGATGSDSKNLTVGSVPALTR
jgi:glucose/arabinose dehydrogenase